ncbi:glycoside hydrolase family 43 protein [Thermothelomyces thermophilus ATCC 42464]|uniref:Glycoside hydrolase family 43 protein n=1 Tax=Thermothelomyces thermophilus (strain ATCC 42464 / BCRC 31852 / DSM 1799) TaxID=573729 RepID=G2QDD9_THET4|nr:glycoside hydrolase family 43 protein [Thermothelomyces thermophilus ATCC 42464]AEO58304.1 glycoside hydrolase family 43 protein [Thermothelomyces thermophilus ATCC 42464]
MRISSATLTAALSSVASASLQVVPGGTWTTPDGEHLQAHGAGFIEVNGTYYMIGEDKSGGHSFTNVNCYSSTDLVQWTYVGALLSQTSSGDLGPNRVVERPKVIYNDKTGKYVLWMHMDSSNYGEARVAVATGDSVCGKYEYIRSFQPLGRESRDMGLFKDDDGKAYLLTEDRNYGLRIVALSDDYLTPTTDVFSWRLEGGNRVEAPAMVKLGDTYFLFASMMTGWDPNDNQYTTSKSLGSGWSEWKKFADQGTNTYNSQTTYILKTSESSAIYMGDRWVKDNLMASTYVWLPLSISGTSVSMKNFVSWVPTSNFASWQNPPAETSYEAEAATYGGKARNIDCSGCSGKVAAGYIGGPDNGSVTFTGIRSDIDGLTTIRIKFLNGDSSPRYANVRVNGDAGRKIAFLTARGDPASSTLHAQLKKGSDNTIVIEGINGGWGPDVDRLMVPVQ